MARFIRDLLLPAVAVAQTVPLPSFYNGCYTEGTNARALTGAALYNYTGMTVPMCQTFCTSKPNNFTLWGLEYGGECYCGNMPLSNGSVPALSASQCNMPCAGNANQTCGGPNALSLYGLFLIPNAASTAPTTGSVAAVAQYQGCRTEGNGTRALTGASAADGSSMTTERCGKFCQEKGFGLFGTEYSAECYCGNTIDASSKNATETDCNMPCSGNKNETCGGPNRLSLYKWQSLQKTVLM